MIVGRSAFKVFKNIHHYSRWKLERFKTPPNVQGHENIGASCFKNTGYVPNTWELMKRKQMRPDKSYNATNYAHKIWTALTEIIGLPRIYKRLVYKALIRGKKSSTTTGAHTPNSSLVEELETSSKEGSSFAFTSSSVNSSGMIQEGTTLDECCKDTSHGISGSRSILWLTRSSFEGLYKRPHLSNNGN